MDPHLLINLAKNDPTIQGIVAKAFKTADNKADLKIRSEMQRVFETEYLPLVIERFQRDALNMLSRWLLLHETQLRLDKK